MLTDVLYEYVEYIKNMFLHVYNNYNYKQIFLFLLVFLTIYVVEKISRLNSFLQSSMPGMNKVSQSSVGPGAKIKEKSISKSKVKLKITKSKK